VRRGAIGKQALEWRRYLSMAWQEPIDDDEPDRLKQLIDEIIRPRTFN
jgi:hypothetical protein